MPSKRAKTGAAEAHIELRRTEAIKLRLKGYDYKTIGQQLGVSLAQAYRDVAAVLERTRNEANEKAGEIRELELARLDVAIKALEPKVRKGEARAIDTMLRCQERRAKFLGLDAAEKHQHDLAPTLADLIGISGGNQGGSDED